MAGIVFYFEDNDIDVWSGRKIDLDAWNYSCKIGGIDKVIIINKTEEDIKPFDSWMDIKIVKDFDINSLDGHTTQLVTPNETISTSLWDFDHKTDWYIIGPASGWCGVYEADKKITIPQGDNGHHHSVFVASTVMYHRYNTIYL